MNEPGYAVIAVETTGLSPKRHDRIVEVAVVHLDKVGRVTGVWETMIDPQRAPGGGHGLTAETLAGAPTFAQAGPSVVDLIAGRVVVSHTVSFEEAFLSAELKRLGYELPRSVTTLSTSELAREFLPGSDRALGSMCATCGIDVDPARSASATAVATAKLLSSFIYASPMWHGWAERLTAANTVWKRADGERVNWVPRATLPPAPANFLQRIASKLPGHSGPLEELDYLSLLDRCVADQDISAQEADELVAHAEGFGIDRGRVAHLHTLFFGQLVRSAWADGALTMDEMSQLVAVGALLSIDADTVQRAMERPAA
jgi:DNA polymerase-3 subunit epsilon